MSLNQMVYKGLSEAVRPHQETGDEYSSRVKELQGRPSGKQESKEGIQRIQAFHKANLERYQSLCKGIADHTPLSGLLTDMKQAHEAMLEQIPARLENPAMPKHRVRAKQLYRQLFDMYLDKVADLVLETRKEITRSMSILLQEGFNPLTEIRWQELYKDMLDGYFREHQEHLSQGLNRSGKYPQATVKTSNNTGIMPDFRR